jgi:hypothetical protein
MVAWPDFPKQEDAANRNAVRGLPQRVKRQIPAEPQEAHGGEDGQDGDGRH